MKKLFLLLSVAILACSCDETEELNPDGDNTGSTGDTSGFTILTFEDEDAATASYWSSLISSDESYITDALCSWVDTDNTGLATELAFSDWGYGGGGIAISNYYTEVVSGTSVSYGNQLSVPYKSSDDMSGNNGSENFAVLYNGFWEGSNENTPSIFFEDGVARTVDHMYICVTSYFKSAAIDGSEGYCYPIDSDDWFTLYAAGINGTNEPTSAEYAIIKGGEIIDGWVKWDLTSLGEVTEIMFSTGSSQGGIPTYIAIDDIAVVMEEE